MANEVKTPQYRFQGLSGAIPVTKEDLQPYLDHVQDVVRPQIKEDVKRLHKASGNAGKVILD
jgi:hypothetical protein